MWFRIKWFIKFQTIFQIRSNKSFIILAVQCGSVNELARPISASLFPNNTPSSKKCRGGGEALATQIKSNQLLFGMVQRSHHYTFWIALSMHKKDKNCESTKTKPETAKMTIRSSSQLPRRSWYQTKANSKNNAHDDIYKVEASWRI